MKQTDNLDQDVAQVLDLDVSAFRDDKRRRNRPPLPALPVVAALVVAGIATGAAWLATNRPTLHAGTAAASPPEPQANVLLLGPATEPKAAPLARPEQNGAPDATPRQKDAGVAGSSSRSVLDAVQPAPAEGAREHELRRAKPRHRRRAAGDIAASARADHLATASTEREPETSTKSGGSLEQRIQAERLEAVEALRLLRQR